MLGEHLNMANKIAGITNGNINFHSNHVAAHSRDI